MMCTNDAFFLFLCCMHCDKFVILHMFVEEINLPGLCYMLLYSTVIKTSMSMSRVSSH